MKLLTTNEAAEQLGVSARRVRALIDAGTLPAHQLGREYAIEEKSLACVTIYGKPGRPKKAKAEDAPASATNGTTKAAKKGKAK